jgi:uncharacterized protein
LGATNRIELLVKDHLGDHLETWKYIWDEARKIYSENGSHGMEHVFVVCNNVITICQGESISDIDLRISIAAATLHDVGRYIPSNSKHSSTGAEWLRKITSNSYCKEASLFWPKVAMAIDNHNEHQLCQYVYEKILWDADKLDLVGFSGLVRMGIRSGELGGSRILHTTDGIQSLYKEIEEKIESVHYKKFFFNSSRKIAKKGWSILNAAFNELDTIRRIMEGL